MFMVAYLALSIIAAAIIQEFGLPYWATIILSEVVMLTPVVLYFVAMRLRPSDLMDFGRIGIMDFIEIYILAYTVLPLVYFLNIITMLFAENHVDSMVVEIVKYPLIIQLFLMAFCPAVAEEFVFRGVFYGAYRKRNVLAGVILSALVFGIVHLNLNQFAYAFAMGIIFAVLAEATGSVFAPMVAHFAINANTVFLAYIQGMSYNLEEVAAQSETVMETIPSQVLIVTLCMVFVAAVIGLLLAAVIIRHLARKKGRLEHLQGVFRNGMKPVDENAEKSVDIVFVVTAAAALLYMISREL